MTAPVPRPSVWILDDSPLELEVARRALEDTFEVRPFSDGTVLLEHLARDPQPDALVVDWHMPMMSGLELCQFVRQSRDASVLPIVILTATRRRADLLEAFAGGANDFVKKPFDAEELAARVATAVQTKHLNAMLRSDAEFRERFIGILGHDLRQPLNTLTIGTGVLLNRELSEGDAKTVRRLSNATLRMTRMISDLLDLTRSRLGGGIPVGRVAMNFIDACREVVEELEIANPQSPIVLRTSGDGQGTWDRDRVLQICTNLIGNALDYGTPGTPIVVTVSGDPEGVTLDVENQGRQIPPALRESIFDPFRSGSKDESAGRKGLGLGLFIAKEIASGHGGSITVDSDDTRTRFSVRMPRH